MNILYITNSPIIGGAELSLLSHIKELDKTKFNVTLICSSVLLEKAKEIKDIKIIPMEFFTLYRLSPMSILNYIKMSLNISGIVKHEHIDLIHTNSVKAHYLSFLIKLLTNKKIIWWVRDDTMNKLIFSLTKFIPSKIIYISKYIETYYKENKNSIVIYNGTNIYKSVISEDEKNKLRNKLNIKDEVVIICSERLVKWKGVQILISALNKIRNEKFICLIIGTGDNQRDNFEKEIKKNVKDFNLENNVKFIGWSENINEYFQIANILVHPVINPEPFGLVVIEGMSFNLSVISSNIGGPSEIIDDNIDGFLIEPNNDSLLSEKLKYLINNKEICQEVGKKAKQKVLSKFTQEIETKNIESLYKELSN